MANGAPALAAAKLLGKTGQEAMAQKQQEQMAAAMAQAQQQARVAQMQRSLDSPSETQAILDFNLGMAAAQNDGAALMFGLPSGRRVDVLLSRETTMALHAALTARIGEFDDTEMMLDRDIVPATDPLYAGD